MLPLLLLLHPLLLLSPAAATGVIRVRHKYGGSRPLADLRAHDARRHARILSAVDLPLGGLGSASDTGLYFAEIGIGTPAKRYYVQVDTGSDIMWVNCASCRACPRKSDLKIELLQYDVKGSGSGDLVLCDQGFCTSMFGEVSGCTGGEPCQFKIGYGDGSETAGYFVSDILQYDRVSGNHQTAQVNTTITFGSRETTLTNLCRALQDHAEPWRSFCQIQEARRMITRHNIEHLHIFREGNAVADAAAKLGHAHEGLRIYKPEDLPQQIKKKIREDKLQIGNFCADGRPTIYRR